MTKPKNPYIVVLDATSVTRYPALPPIEFPERYMVKHYPAQGDFAWTANALAASHMGEVAAEKWASRVRNVTGLKCHAQKCDEVVQDRDLVYPLSRGEL